jgi:lysine 6-dehydrogenase
MAGAGDRTYVIVGAGRQGAAAAYDLGRFGGAQQVRILDRDAALAERAAERVNGLLSAVGADRVCSARALDAADVAAARQGLAGAHAVMSCVPYFLNAGLARAAVAVGASFCDLGGNTAVSDEVLSLDSEAKAAGVTLTPDCGLAPGMANTLAACLIGRLAAPEAAWVRCGGLPQNPRPPLDYMITFAVEGLTNEYTGACLVLRDGAVTTVPAFAEDEDEMVEVDGVGRLEAFTTSGGSGNLPRTLAGRLDRFDYKTLRYPGHAAKVRLLAALGLLELEPVEVRTADGATARVAPREMLHRCIVPRLTFPEEPDLVVLRVAAEGGDAEGRRVRHTLEIVDRYDPGTGFTAMERTTAFPAAIICRHLASGDAPPGGQPLEQVMDGEAFLAELRRRDIPISESVNRDLG